MTALPDHAGLTMTISSFSGFVLAVLVAAAARS
jgi:hypothetical protein